MSEKSFDVLVIGAGPGGYVAAIRAGQLGLSVACIEEDKLGGVCLNIGCIPTKALLTSAALVNEVKTAESHGITFDGVKAALGPAQERSRAIAGQLSSGVAHLLKQYKATHLEGRGRLLGGGKVEVEAGDESDAARQVREEVIVLCHGGPISMPEDATHILASCVGCDGFYGASSMERLPTEQALVEQTRKFKEIGRV